MAGPWSGIPTCPLQACSMARWPVLPPPPLGQGGDRGSRNKPQCSVHCCIMTLFMGWVENSAGEPGTIFMRLALPTGRGWTGLPGRPHLVQVLAGLPNLTPPWWPDMTLRGPGDASSSGALLLRGHRTGCPWPDWPHSLEGGRCESRGTRELRRLTRHLGGHPLPGLGRALATLLRGEGSGIPLPLIVPGAAHLTSEGWVSARSPRHPTAQGSNPAPHPQRSRRQRARADRPPSGPAPRSCRPVRTPGGFRPRGVGGGGETQATSARPARAAAPERGAPESEAGLSLPRPGNGHLAS